MMMLFTTLFLLLSRFVLADFWLESVPHEGLVQVQHTMAELISVKSTSTYGPSGYKVYRNVKDYGAVGDGKTDDTASIQKAISDGPRCEQDCGSSTRLPALVYFPSGTYAISSSIKMPYFTQLVGDYNDMPVLLALPAFGVPGKPGGWMVDANPYGTTGKNWVASTTAFFAQIRNFVCTHIQVIGEKY
jgi:glucan 1,3-beta-glucosidase